MNLVSRLYGECFAGQLGAWCTERGVDYIGHIIEDNDAHTRLGASVPHFFRAMDGQTMGGIDVVLGQVRPGLDQRMFNWPTWWLSEMAVNHEVPWVRFKHIGGVTTRMDVEWSFTPVEGGTLTRIVHVWNGPLWPVIGRFAATQVIAPVFVHGIASRTLAGLAAVAERTPS